MANIIIDTNPLIVYKGEDFNIDFTIEKPNPTIVETVSYEMIYNSDLDIGKMYTTGIDKTNWFRLDSFLTREDGTTGKSYIDVSGLKYVGYKYKVELYDYVGNLISIIKDYELSFNYDIGTYSCIVPITNIATSVNNYKIKITVLQSDSLTNYTEREITLYNNPPTIIGSINNNKFSLSIGDETGDLIRYNVKLNGEKIYPLDSEITSFIPPETNTISLPTDKINIGEENTIIIYAEDNWGKSDIATYTFIGDYNGLLFADENDKYYSTDLGVILKRLDFGTVVAGQFSNIKTIKILNKTGNDINNLRVSINLATVQNKLQIFYTFLQPNFLESTNVLEYKNGDYASTIDGVVKNNEYIYLYIHIKPDIEFEYRDGFFEINIEATPVV